MREAELTARSTPRLLLQTLPFLALAMSSSRALSKPVVLTYHRFELRRVRNAVVTQSDFDAQLAYLKKNGIEVLAGQDTVSTMRQGKSLPNLSVNITIDAGWRSTRYLPKADIKEFAQDPSCAIANHSYSHSVPVMSGAPQKAPKNLERAQSDIDNMTGRRPEPFVYPYGIVNRALREFVASLGFPGAVRRPEAGGGGATS